MEKEEEVGRRKTRYSDNIREYGWNQSFVDFYRLVQNRQAWRATIVLESHDCSAKSTSPPMMMILVIFGKFQNFSR